VKVNLILGDTTGNPRFTFLHSTDVLFNPFMEDANVSENIKKKG
jgi:hypothetical protein